MPKPKFCATFHQSSYVQWPTSVFFVNLFVFDPLPVLECLLCASELFFPSRSIQVGLMVRPRERASNGVWRKNVVTYPNCKYLPVWFSGHKIELCCWPFIVQLMERKLNWPTPARGLIELLSKRWKYEHIESTIQCNREEWNSVE